MENSNYSLLIFVGIWFAINFWILPKLGVNTWMRGACSVEYKKKSSKKGLDNGDNKEGLSES